MNISPFILERHFARYEFEVPFQLSCSDCEPLAINELLAMASPGSIRLWENLKLSYTDSSGHPLLRKEISKLYKDVNPRDILVCVPEEGIFLVMNSLLKEGDHLVVISPAYQSLYSIAEGLGCTISPWEPDCEGNFHIDTGARLLKPDTRMVVVNFPHNPTGAMISADELTGLSRICEEKGIILFSDEMYRGLEQDPTDRLPCVADLSKTGIALSGMSKSFALPGLRIGWLVCRDPEILGRLLQLKDYTTICSSAPSEILAIIGLQEKEQIMERNLAIIKHNITLVNDFVSRNSSSFSWNAPKAGSVAMLKLIAGQPVELFCQELLVKKEVLAIGSYLFSFPELGIRLGLGRVDFSYALERSEELL